jgi:hypothetical protein
VALAHQISQPDHFTAVVNTVMVQILKDLAPLQLRFIGDIASSCHRLSLITRINTLS